LPVPRVASDPTAVHHTFNSPRPTASEPKEPAAPFSALLDDASSAPPPSPPDRPERPQPGSAQSSPADAASGAKQPDQGAQREQDNADDGNRTDSTDSTGTQQPAADAKTDKAGAKDAKAGTKDAKAGDDADKPADADKSAPADTTDAAALATAFDASAPQAAAPVPAATASAAAALVAAIDAPAPSQPAAGAPVTAAAADPGAILPAAAAAANEIAGAKGARIATADALGGEVQGAVDTDTTSAADGKAQAGRKGAIALTSAGGGTDAGKPQTAKPGTSIEDNAASKIATGPTNRQAPPQTSAQSGAQSGSDDLTAKDEPARHASRGLAQDGTQKPGEARVQADIQVPGTTDQLPAGATQVASPQNPADRFANLVATPVQPGAAASDQAAVPIAGLAVEIAARAQSGSNRFEIRLDPPDLGRIDVRLDIDRDGHVTSRLMVEKPETLDLLRRDAPELERALQQAGLKTGDSGLQFALRDQSFGQNQPGNSSPSTAKLVVADPEMPPVETVPGVYSRALRLGTGIDIRV
jgi:chemotaxis protein MotD